MLAESVTALIDHRSALRIVKKDHNCGQQQKQNSI